MSNYTNTDNLLVLESSVVAEVPLKQSMLAVLGEKYAESVESLLKNTSKLILVILL